MCAGRQTWQRGAQAEAVIYLLLLWGLVSLSEQNKTGRRAAWWLTSALALVPFWRSLVTPSSVILLCFTPRICADVMARLQRDELQFESRLYGTWKGGWHVVTETGVPGDFNRPVLSPPAAVPGQPSGRRVSSSAGWTSSHFSPGSLQQLDRNRKHPSDRK